MSVKQRLTKRLAVSADNELIKNVRTAAANDAKKIIIDAAKKDFFALDELISNLIEDSVVIYNDPWEIANDCIDIEYLVERYPNKDEKQIRKDLPDDWEKYAGDFLKDNGIDGDAAYVIIDVNGNFINCADDNALAEKIIKFMGDKLPNLLAELKKAA